jgi:hypothetical protein
MTNIYRASEFALTQAAVEQMLVIREDHIKYFPNDPPVVAGIFVAYPLVEGRPGHKRVVIGFWRQSEFPPEAWEHEGIAEVAGFHVILDVLKEDRPMFRGAVIDYAPDRAFFLRPHSPGSL